MRDKIARMTGSYISIMLVGLFLTATPVQASRVRPVNLEQMAQHADRIFSGRCVSVRAEKDTDLGLMVTRVTFAVQKAAKGNVKGRVTIRVLGGQDETTEQGRPMDGVPRFQVGEEVVLFLYGDSSAGLTSPVGLGQGKFSVLTDKRGQKLAVNAVGNENLFERLSDRARGRLGRRAAAWEGRRPIPPDELLDIVRMLQEQP